VALLHSCPDGQAAHSAPPAPHDALDSLASTSHEPLLQQPLHEPPPQLQTPLEHACPEEQALHEAPAVPHTEVDWDAYRTHVLPLQQPAGHDAASQMQLPLAVLHVCPVPHAAQVAPPVPQESAVSDP
jgi:hypothetical protein